MRFIIISFLIILATKGIAQTPAKPIAMADPVFNAYFYKTKPPVVSGKIINASAEELKTLNINYTLVVPFEGLQEKATCAIKSDGSFSFQLDFPFPYQQIWFSLGDYFYSGIYVNKGIYLELDFAQLKKNHVFLIGPGAKYLGEDGPATEYANKFVLFKRDEQLAASTAFYRLNPKATDYITKVDSIYALTGNIEAEYIKENASPYSWILENERLSSYYAAVTRQGLYNNLEPAKWNEIINYKPLLVSNDSGDFFQALYSYLFYKKAKGNAAALANITDIPNIDPTILQASSLKDVRADEARLASLINAVKTPWVKTVLKKRYENTVKRLKEVNAALKAGAKANGDTTLGEAVGVYPFGGKLYDAGNVTASQFLGKLTSKFKGKAMLIDIWATWCVPCIAAMPKSAQLHHEAADLPLEFIYLCTSSGSNKATWKDRVVELKQPGIHIFINDKLTGELMAMFKKGGYPSYICLDQTGQVSKDVSIDFISPVSLDDLKKLASK